MQSIVLTSPSYSQADRGKTKGLPLRKWFLRWTKVVISHFRFPTILPDDQIW